jgi:hypothetical protein
VPLDARPTIETLDKDRRRGTTLRTYSPKNRWWNVQWKVSVDRTVFCAGKKTPLWKLQPRRLGLSFLVGKKVMGVFGGDCRLLPLDRPCTLIFANLELVGSAIFRFEVLGQ